MNAKCQVTVTLPEQSNQREDKDIENVFNNDSCEHGRQKSECKDCGGSGICEHGRQRSQCKDCGGSGICEHGQIRSKCKDCGGCGSKTIKRGIKRTQSDITDENIANVSANEGRNFTIV